MTSTYHFSNAEGTSVGRFDDDGVICVIPWAGNKPEAFDSVATRQWIDDGSPVPDPYVEPPPPAPFTPAP